MPHDDSESNRTLFDIIPRNEGESLGEYLSRLEPAIRDLPQEDFDELLGIVEDSGFNLARAALGSDEMVAAAGNFGRRLADITSAPSPSLPPVGRPLSNSAQRRALQEALKRMGADMDDEMARRMFGELFEESVGSIAGQGVDDVAALGFLRNLIPAASAIGQISFLAGIPSETPQGLEGPLALDEDLSAQFMTGQMNIDEARNRQRGRLADILRLESQAAQMFKPKRGQRSSVQSSPARRRGLARHFQAIQRALPSSRSGIQGPPQ